MVEVEEEGEEAGTRRNEDGQAEEEESKDLKFILKYFEVNPSVSSIVIFSQF